MAEYTQLEMQIVKPGECVIFDGFEQKFSGHEEAILKVAAGIVLNKLKECELFCGKYDARNGNEHYMFGVSTVMEVIANYAGDEEFINMFLKNMEESDLKK